MTTIGQRLQNWWVGKRRGGEGNNPSAKYNGQLDSSHDKNKYRVHERGVQFIHGACDGRVRVNCVCGGCVLIDKFYLKLHFSRHTFQLK